MGAASRHDASRGKLDTTDQRGSGRISGVLRPRYAAPPHGARHRIRRPVPPSPPLDGYVTHTGGRFPGLRVIAPVPPSQDFHPSGAGWTGTRRSQLRGQPWLRPTESALHVPFIPFREPTVPAFSQSRHRRSIQSADPIMGRDAESLIASQPNSKAENPLRSASMVNGLVIGGKARALQLCRSHIRQVTPMGVAACWAVMSMPSP